MQKTSLLIIFILIAITACKEETTQDLEYTLPELTTKEDHRVFLEQLFKDDQDYRIVKNSLDPNSKNYKADEEKARDSISYYDALNLIKVQKYLEVHPYPSLTTYGDKMSIAPLMVVHHQPLSTNSRAAFFPVFYNAYKNGDIDANMFALYLGRWYQFTYGEYYRMESPYMIEDQINALIKELGLEIPN